MRNNAYDEVIDQEWLELILEAREIGLSISEIREFINQKMTA